MAAITNITTQIMTMQADLGTCKTRLDQWEQPNQNAPPPLLPRRNVQHAAPRDPRQEEEPPDLQQPQQQQFQPPPPLDPIQAANDSMQRNQAYRNRFRDDERNLSPEVKLTAPTFPGKIDPAAYLE